MQGQIISNTRRVTKRKKRPSDIIVENWHSECHAVGSRLYKLTIALSLENEFNDLDVISYVSNDGHMLSKEIGD